MGKSAQVQTKRVKIADARPIKTRSLDREEESEPMSNVFKHYFPDSFIRPNDFVAIGKVFKLGQLHINDSTDINPIQVTFETSYDEEVLAYIKGLFYFKKDAWVFAIKLGNDSDHPDCMQVFCPEDGAIEWFKETFYHYRYVDNIYKGKTFRLDENGITFVNPKKSDYKDLVLEESLKETVYDQSVFFLENMKGMNGVILYGEPGTGKSYTSASIAYECLKKNITVITIYNVNQTAILSIKDFVHKFCHVCLVCIEDIDSAAQSRELRNSENTLAPLLEFMDGFESNLDISCVVFATTNHIEKLDNAIGNRPCRFNRKIKFEYLKFDQVTTILDRLFDSKLNSDEIQVLKNKPSLTPSHLAEMLRTAKIMSLKKTGTLEPWLYFKDACKEVLDSFTLTISSKPIGFNTPY